MKKTQNPTREEIIQNFLSALEEDIKEKTLNLEILGIRIQIGIKKNLVRWEELKSWQDEITTFNNILTNSTEETKQTLTRRVNALEVGHNRLKNKTDKEFELWELKKPLENAILEAVVTAMTRFADDLKKKQGME